MCRMKIIPLLLMVFAALAVEARENDRDLFRQAETRFRNQEYELALDRYETLVRNHPYSRHVPDAQFRIGVTQYRLGRHENALRTLRRVESRFRSTRFLAYVPFWMGLTQFELERFAEAADSLDRFLESPPEEDLLSRAYLYRALAAQELDQTPRPYLEALLEGAQTPESEPYALALLLVEYIRQDDFGRVLEWYEQIDPEQVDERWRGRVVLYAAEAYRAADRQDRAIELYERVSDASVDIATVALQRRFQTAQADGDDEELDRIVREAEERLAGRQRVLADFWTRAGIESFRRQRFDRAGLYLQRVWDLRDSTEVEPAVALYLAELDERRDERGRAIEILEEQKARDTGERARVAARLGALYLAEGEYERAEEMFLLALEEDPVDGLESQVRYQLALARHRRSDSDEALATIGAIFSEGMTGGLSTELLRLRAAAERTVGRYSDAGRTLREYLSARPSDLDGRLEYMKVLFLEGRHERVLEAAQELTETYEQEQERYEERPELLRRRDYLVGLSATALGEYDRAAEALSGFYEEHREASDGHDAESIEPYALFYLGFARYRLGEYGTATDILRDFASAYGDHRLTGRALYTAAWASYNDRRFADSEELLVRLLDHDLDESAEVETRYLLGRTLFALDRPEAAAEEYTRIHGRYPDSAYADDAMFEAADILVAMGELEAASERFARLHAEYPQSSLADPAMYRRAEAFYGAGEYERAAEAFREYREGFPDGQNIDAALYYGGAASEELGESGAALLLWQRIIDDYRDSGFRFDAMHRAAERHEERNELRDALALYTDMTSRYPEQAKEIGAQRRADELVLRVSGLTRDESRLLVDIEEHGEAETAEGREAILELSRIVVYERQADAVNRRLVVPLLEDTASRAAEDRERAAEAHFLLGEWYFQLGEYADAADSFLEAAEVYPVDRDRAAQSLYRAAVAHQRRGQDSVVAELVEELSSSYPDSEWAEEAQDL